MTTTNTFSARIAQAAQEGYIGTPRERRTRTGRTVARKAITERQESFLRSLIRDRINMYRTLEQNDAADALTRFMAMEFNAKAIPNPSVAIEKVIATNNELKEFVKKQRATPTVDPGIYSLDGVFYRVKQNQAKTGVYAQLIVNTEQADGTFKTSFEYVSGVVFKLTPADKLTLAQAAEHGAAFGTCISCGRTLKRAESIERQIGPICYAKNFG